MNKQITFKIFTVAVIILIFSQLNPIISISAAQNQWHQQLNPNEKQNEWDDGILHGNWITSSPQNQGTIQGKLNMGRSSEMGIISGTIYDSQQVNLGTVHVRFIHSILFGWLSVQKNQNLPIPVIGRFTMRTESTLNATVKLSTLDTIEVNCTYSYSFLPPLTGPYEVGVINRHIIDGSREEQFTTDPNDHREFMLRIWYPMEKENAKDTVDYMDYWTFQWLKNRSPVPLITISDNAYLSIRPHGFSQGTLAESTQLYPILVFSPGYDGNYEIYSSFIENLVSHGYIIVSMNHPYVSGLTIFPDGRRIPASPVEPFSFESVVGDALFTIDYLFELNQTDPIFHHQLDLESMGMYGHSFGGAATIEVMKQDSRIKAGLTLDGAIGHTLLPESFDRPLFLMLAEDSFAQNGSIDLFTITDDGYLLTILGSTHYAFTDVGVLMSHFIPNIPPHLLLFGTIDAKRMVNITRSFILTFFDTYLKDHPRENILTLNESYPETILQHK